MKTDSKLSRRTIVGAAAGIAGTSLMSGAAFAQKLPLPRSPVELNFLDSAGNLQITQAIMENYRKAKPNLVSKINYIKAPQPEVVPKLKAMMAAGRMDIDISGTGSSGVSLGMSENLYMPLLPTHSASLPKLDDILIDRAKPMQALVKGFAVICGHCPYGPLLEYMPDRVANPPTTADDLLTWARAHKGKFMYGRPINSGLGIAFMFGLPYILKDADPKDPIKGWDKTWAYLKAIGETIEYYPAGSAAVLKEFAEGSRDMFPTVTPFDVNPRALGIVPKEAKIVAIKGFHWINEAQYWAVPRGVSNEKLAVILDMMNFMLTPQQQAYVYDNGYMYPGPAVKGVTLSMAPAESQKVIKEFGRPEYDQLIANNPHETPLEPEKIVLAFRRWDEEIGGSKRR